MNIKTILLLIILTVTQYSFAQTNNNHLIIKLYDDVFENLELQKAKNIFNKSASIKHIKPLCNYDRSEIKKNKQFRSKLYQYYRIELYPGINSSLIKEQLNKSKYVESVINPIINTPLYTPNDPGSDTSNDHNDGAQYTLKHHSFLEAWDIEKGDTNVTIGYVDTGFNINHEDLQKNLKHNYNDPIDGINNDEDSSWYGNEYLPLTDNFSGWDLADWDNNVVNTTGGHHGTTVAGVASATPDNNIGIAGVGFNCKYIPYKVSPDISPAFISHGYDGLIMAAEEGNEVINLSWGSPRDNFGESTLELIQNIIDYVVYDHDAVIVASSGNTPSVSTRWAPACMDNVLSVSSVQPDKSKMNKVSFYYEVDIAAQGWRSQTTGRDENDGYLPENGTSLAAPVVSGAAALLRSHYPSWNAIQISEQLRVSGSIIDTLPDNIIYKEQIGKYLEPYNALTLQSPALRVSNTNLTEGTIVKAGDTVHLNTLIKNHLYKCSSCKVKIEVTEGNIIALDSIFNLGYIDSLNSLPINDIRIAINESARDTINAVFRFSFTNSDSSYSDYQYVRLPIIIDPITKINNHLSNETTKPFVVYPIINDLRLMNVNTNTITITAMDGRSINVPSQALDNSSIQVQNINQYLTPGQYIISVIDQNGNNQNLKLSLF